MPQQIYGSPIVTVAASNTPRALRSAANFICDGAADQVEIQAAIGVLGGNGGTVYLLPGNFFTNGTINVATESILGSGQSATVISASAGPIFSFTGPAVGVFSDFKMIAEANFVAVLDGGLGGINNPIVFERVEFKSFGGTASCVVTGQGYVFRDCVFEWSGVAIELRSGGNKHVIDSNSFNQGCIIAGNMDNVIITKNKFKNTSGGGIAVTGSPAISVLDGTAIIVFSGSQDCLIIDNIIDNPAKHGVSLTGEPATSTGGPSQCTVSRNTIKEPKGYGIFLDDDASFNVIKDNFIYGTGPSAAGISIDEASCAGNWVTNNDLSEVTGISFNNAGTATITAAGNRL